MQFISNFFIFILILILLYYLFSKLILPLMIRRFVNKRTREFKNNIEKQDLKDNRDGYINRINKDKTIQEDFGDYTDYEEIEK